MICNICKGPILFGQKVISFMGSDDMLEKHEHEECMDALANGLQQAEDRCFSETKHRSDISSQISKDTGYRPTEVYSLLEQAKDDQKLVLLAIEVAESWNISAASFIKAMKGIL